MKTLQIQTTYRPDPARPIAFRGSLHDWWISDFCRSRAIMATSIHIGGEEGDEAEVSYRRPVVVALDSDHDSDKTQITITHLDGKVYDNQVWNDDYINDLRITGVVCDVETSARMVQETLDPAIDPRSVGLLEVG